MNYRQYLDWQISEIGFGCYGLSGAYGKPNIQSFKKTIHHAYEHGVNFFDTAEGYGEAESFLGETLAPFREKVMIATKISGESGEPDLSASAVKRSCEGSLKRLKTDVIDLYQIHFDDPQTPILETISGLEDLKAEGKIRQYGLCHLSLERVVDYVGQGQVFSILMELSPVARTSLETLLPVCIKHDLAALAFSITGRGILTGNYTADHLFEEGDIRRMDPLFKRERFQSALRVRNYLAEIGINYGASAVQMGIAWVLAQSQIVCALTGTSSIIHLDENLATSEIAIEAEDLAALDRFLDEEETCLFITQRKTVERLLTEPLDRESEAAFNDLVYVMETAIIAGQVAEAEVVPAFRELLAVRGNLDSMAQQKMRGIQAFLRELILKSG